MSEMIKSKSLSSPSYVQLNKLTIPLRCFCGSVYVFRLFSLYLILYRSVMSLFVDMLFFCFFGSLDGIVCLFTCLYFNFYRIIAMCTCAHQQHRHALHCQRQSNRVKPQNVKDQTKDAMYAFLYKTPFLIAT